MSQTGKKRSRALAERPDAKLAKHKLQEEEGSSMLAANKRSSKPTGSGTGKATKKAACPSMQGSKQAYSHWLMKSEPESRLKLLTRILWSSNIHGPAWMLTAQSPSGGPAAEIAAGPARLWAARSELTVGPSRAWQQFGIEELKTQPNQTACWDGVRNYQARNFMRDMKVGQEAFFYHSNCKEPGIAGIIKIVKEAYPDHTQFDKKDPHYDSSSTKANPKWSMVDVQFVRMTKRFIPLSELKAHHQAHRASGGPLKDMTLFTRQRLSVQPLTDEEFEFVLSLEEKPS
ncbi:thymocyte nuclear protein 1-like isoform X1 [Pelodiscus sinensis]|uniref:thymocyte nuclear protein 1-like isoform X1 n=1 Tax=Pelodiscus sinensis TaxID=13735 RepID=UPI003F6D50F0